MHKRNITANFDIKQIFVDIMFILLAYSTSLWLYDIVGKNYLARSHFWIFLVFSIIFVLCMLQYRMYNITTFFYYDRIIVRVLISAVLAGLCISMIIFLSKMGNISRLMYLTFCAFSVLFVTMERLLIRWSLRSHLTNGYTRVLFVGSDRALQKYREYLEKTSMKIKVVDVFDFDDSRIITPQALESYMVDTQIDEVQIVFSPDNMSGINYESYLKTCEEMGITSRIILDMYNLPNSEKFVSSIGTFPVLTYHSISFDKVQLFFKSIVDITGSIIGLMLLSPVLLCTAIAIKLDSPGPVLFKQERAGINGKVFEMYKFRSMYIDAEERKQGLMGQNKIKDGFMFKMDDDPRITKVGKFIRKTSIDELPQLINVLKREMSLVGTRPPTLDEVQKYKRNHWRRISIMPGITGMWQVNGRSDILDFDRVVELDVEYINNWSLSLDFKLIFKTFAAVISRHGAS